MADTYDVVIVGAGIFGASTGYYMKKTHPELKVLIIDKSTAVAQGNTSKSVSMVRDSFTSPISYALAFSSIQVFCEMQKKAPGGIDLNRMMYLWLFTKEQTERNMPAVQRLKAANVDVELFTSETLAQMAPCMVIDPQDDESRAYGLPAINSGLLCRNCFSLDPIAITQNYIEQYKQLGGELRLGVEAVDFIYKPVKPLVYEGEEIPGQPFPAQPQKVGGIKLKNGSIEAGTVILATGAWSRELTDKLGKGSLLSPKKRQWFYVEGHSLSPLFKLPAFGNEDGTLPFTILPSGIYLKPSREGGFYVALADDIGRSINLDTVPERDYFINGIHPFVKGYFPQFESVTLKAMDAGSYCYDEVYRTPIVDWVYKGVMLVSGDSGSGIMKADAVGRIAVKRFEINESGDGMAQHNLVLPGDLTVNAEDLTIRGRRRIEPERLVI